VVVTVEAQPRQSSAAGPGEGDNLSRPDGRFTYPSGSRPLDGYTLKRGVGHGGFGEVYYATSDAGKEVALKLIRRNLDVELRGIRQCLNLKHPNLLLVFDIRQDESGDNWVVMEYVRGHCLEELLDDYPQGMPPAQAMAWFSGMSAAVGYLHDHGIVHRDLKPGNIFCDEGIVKIGDYGLSKYIACSRRSGHTQSIGTVHYMAPEVANGRYGHQIDIYALGVILYEMLTGRVPFEGESVGEVLMKHLTAAPDVSVLAEPFRSVVAQALEKDPDRRFRSATEMFSRAASGGQWDHASPLPGGASGTVVAPVPGEYRPDANAGQGAGLDPGPVPENAAASTRPAGEGASPPPSASAGKSAATEDYRGLSLPGREEPIWAVLRRLWEKGRTAWKESKLDTPTKIAVLIAAVFVFFTTPLGHLAIGLLILYGVYLMVRAVILAFFPAAARHWSIGVGGWGIHAADANVCPASTAGYAAAHGAACAGQAATAPPRGADGPSRHENDSSAYPRWYSRGRHGRATQALVLGSPRQRVAELIGSMVVGALVAVIMSLVMAIAANLRSEPWPGVEESAWLAWLAWLAWMGIVGTWAVLIPSKFWEGSRGEPVVRRFILMVIGLGVGVAVWWAASLLLVELPAEPRMFALRYPFPNLFYDNSGHPRLLTYVACFGALMFLVRWWRQADPLRRVRISFWPLLGSALAAMVIAAVLQLQQPWPVMVAVIMSVSIQLASPWAGRNRAAIRN
jgi:hypothetical protein